MEHKTFHTSGLAIIARSIFSSFTNIGNIPPSYIHFILCSLIVQSFTKKISYYDLCWLLMIRCYHCIAHETSRVKSYVFPRLLVGFMY